MRILLIGDLRSHTRTSQRLRAFVRLGHEVHAVTTVPLLYGGEDPTRSIGARILYRLGAPPDDTGANRALVEEASRNEYDLLWVEKAQVLRSSTLRAIRARRPAMRFAFFSEDNMMARSNRSVWFKRALSMYDTVFTTKTRNAQPEELPSYGARRVVFVPKTFDPELHRPVVVEPGDVERYGATVGFIGTFEQERALALLGLARAGIRVRVWGEGWAEWQGRHEGLRLEGHGIYEEEYVRALCTTDINLGFLRKAHQDQHTDRSIEIPACGAFLLAERTQEHVTLLREGEEAEFFGDLFELSAKVHYYIARPEERKRIAAGGRGRCLAADYSHDASITRMLETLLSQTRRRSA
jgi:hypothetical protein